MSEVGGVAGDRLRSFIEQIERLEEKGRRLPSIFAKCMPRRKRTALTPRSCGRS